MFFGKVWGILDGILVPMKIIGKLISTIVNFFLLLLVYITGIGPTSIIGKLVGKQFMHLNSKEEKTSFWIERDWKTPTKEEYQRLF